MNKPKHYKGGSRKLREKMNQHLDSTVNRAIVSGARSSAQVGDRLTISLDRGRGGGGGGGGWAPYEAEFKGDLPDPSTVPRASQGRTWGTGVEGRWYRVNGDQTLWVCWTHGEEDE